MGELLLGALALMLVVEGVFPFLNPKGWRRAYEQALKLTDGQLRFIGLASMVLGLLLLAAMR